jgi:uncharacterized membrane protein YvbJ
MKCPECGELLAEDAAFCRKCGAAIQHASPLAEYKRKDIDRQLIIGFVGLVAGVILINFTPLIGWILSIAGGLAVITNLVKKYRK